MRILDLNVSPVTDVETVTTLADGSFTTTQVLGDGIYQAFVAEGTVGTDGTFGIGLQNVTVAGSSAAFPTLELNRYAPISGEILNWSATMGNIRVQLYRLTSAGWQQVGSPASSVTSTDGNFTINVPIASTQYTLNFIAESESSPYADAFLGGELEDPALATHFAGTPEQPVSGLEMTMPDAVSISGTVTDAGGHPIEGIWVWTEDHPDFHEYAETQTDADGHYTLYVRPGLTYAVYAEDWDNSIYESKVYDGWDGCGCDPVFTPVVGTKSGIDFVLSDGSSPPTDIQIIGGVADLDSNFLFGIDVRLFKASGSSWVLVNHFTSFDFGTFFANFGFVIHTLGDGYRLQFVDGDGHILSVLNGATSPDFATSTPLDPLPACYANLPTVSVDTLVFALVDPDTGAGACAALDAAVIPAGSGGSGGVVAPGPRGTGSGTGVVAAGSPSPSPTPSPTPTPSATPRPSASPAPSATPAAEPAPASAPDLWWLLVVGIGILLLVVVGAVVFFVRRTSI